MCVTKIVYLVWFELFAFSLSYTEKSIDDYMKKNMTPKVVRLEHQPLNACG